MRLEEGEWGKTGYNDCMKTDFDILVIGGGAAGFFGALTAAEQNRKLRILILERGEPLAKVRISGGGRCNVTHACFDPAELVTDYPRGARELRGPFSRFQPKDTVAWFLKHAVKLKTEPDGRMFPTSDSSETIVDCLLGEAERLGVGVWTECAVQVVSPVKGGFRVEGAGFAPVTAGKVLFAPGGGVASVYALVRGLGHKVVPPVASLFSFNVRDARIEGLAGVAVAEGEVTLGVKDEHGKVVTARGPVLITHWGVSGPAVLRCSAWGARALAGAGYRAGMTINWAANHTFDSLVAFFQEHKAAHLHEAVGKYDPNGRIPLRLWKTLVTHAGVEGAWGEVPNRGLRALAEAITRGQYEISGKGPFKEEFVTCGGVDLKEVDFKTMESRIVPGLFFAGEVLDIDGLTGGFNFQAAWTTGWLAGKGMGQGA
jgi:predicted Rossmann fold flavoprotein